MSKVWLVTGSASGLGRNIAEAVLASGDRIVATARDPRDLEDLTKQHGDQVCAAALDVTEVRPRPLCGRRWILSGVLTWS